MRFQIGSGARLALATAVVMATLPVSGFGQAAQAPAPAQPAPAAQQPPAATPPAPATPAQEQAPAAAPPEDVHAVAAPGQVLRPLSVDDAVKLALEQNLNVQVERLSPQLADLAISQARTAWTPAVGGGFTGRTQDTPPSSFLSGGQGKITNRNVGGNLFVSQLTPFGTEYQVTYDTSRATTNNIFTSFNPTLSGNFAFSVAQPLLRGLKIDVYRLQLALARKDKEITDVGLQQTIALTIRQVKNAYWEYKYALASLGVARQSLQLAQESLRDTRARVEIGTLAPIDIVEAESEVASRQQAVIQAEAAIGQTEDRLRALIFDPNTPQFWNLALDPSDPVPFRVQSVNVNDAVLRALRERTDLIQNRKGLERTAYSERYYRNQTLPDLNVRLDYNATGLAGTQLLREGNTFPPPVVGEVNRPYGDLLSDIFRSQFPAWTVSVNVSYPIGQSNAEAALATTRLQERQQQINLRSSELNVVTQVRDAGRQLDASSKSVDATRAARVLAERRLDAEEKKFAAGMSTSFLVFQAQRDLSQARINELRAILDYVNAQTDFETVQVAPVAGGGSFTSAGQGGFATGQSGFGGTGNTAGGGVGGGGSTGGANTGGGGAGGGGGGGGQ